MSYKKDQYDKVATIIKNNTDIFYRDPGNGLFRGKIYPFVLQDGMNTLYAPIRQDALDYFSNNNIAWWGGHSPTNHALSSQVACVNHLFPIRENKDAVLKITKALLPDIVDVFVIPSDPYKPAYIQFESVSDADHLNELSSTRGSNCTSIDALIYGRLKDGKSIIILIEWKYTETYGTESKAIGDKGITRKNRYSELIAKSNQLICPDSEIYYYEPFYQLMRQTLWAEQMIKHKNTESVKADDFFHLHVVPDENAELLDRIYPCSGKPMKETWQSHLYAKSKYKVISPAELFEPLNSNEHKDLVCYLRTRYW